MTLERARAHRHRRIRGSDTEIIAFAKADSRRNWPETRSRCGVAQFQAKGGETKPNRLVVLLVLTSQALAPALNPKKKKSDQNAWDLRFDVWSLGLPKFTQTSTRYRQLKKNI